MCGITGSFAYDNRDLRPHVQQAVARLHQRGPASEGIFQSGPVVLGSTRLKIIDITEAGSQPMSDESGQFTIVFNGEVYNFREIRTELQQRGMRFNSASDTEVVLKAYQNWGEDALNRFNGFFAFAIHDHQKDELFLARDRFGIKPLLYTLTGSPSHPSQSEMGPGGEAGFFAFGSEMKALMAFPVSRDLDMASLLQYLHLNYIPAPNSIFQSIKKLMPGHCMRVSRSRVEIRRWYDLPGQPAATNGAGNGRGDYELHKERLRQLLDAAVERRLISDVPLGAFLSGGIDSSIVVALAAKHTSKLKTFSIGFPDNPYFDESGYAKLVAEKYATDHTVFPVTRSELLSGLEPALEYIDEPFADSSALLVSMLSKHTAEHVTVALSGDGGDELFAGYRKHRGEYLVRQGGIRTAAISKLQWLWKNLPKSRETAVGNRIRQFDRFAQVAGLSPAERYWRLCGYTSGSEALDMLRGTIHDGGEALLSEWNQRKEGITQLLATDGSLDAVLRTDLGFILPNDMLHKVDLMSMAHSLEVRVPFLDHRLVEFATALPIETKITSSIQKRIVKDAFAHLLPPPLLTRPKRGFEVPMLAWLRNELRPMLDDLLGGGFLEEQGLFHPPTVAQLRRQLYSRNPKDAAARIYGLLVFQYWWRRNLS
jgi:asparagine synthase (glutamine-hydrolysing)